MGEEIGWGDCKLNEPPDSEIIRPFTETSRAPTFCSTRMAPWGNCNDFLAQHVGIVQTHNYGGTWGPIWGINLLEELGFL